MHGRIAHLNRHLGAPAVSGRATRLESRPIDYDFYRTRASRLRGHARSKIMRRAFRFLRPAIAMIAIIAMLWWLPVAP